jgi:hypothetical protein
VGYDATASPADDVVPEVDVVATADAPTPAATEHEHRGFFLRPHVGFGYVTASGQGTELRGLGFSAGIMIGAAIVKNLVLFGEFAFQVVGSGKYEGPVRPGPGETVGLAAAVFGGGVAYYIMPYNLHASVAVDYLAMQITVGERALLLDPSGFAFHVTLGKEWYVSRRLGLGLAAQALLGFVGDYTLFGIGLAGTLTFD